MASEMAPAAGTFAREESELDPLTQPYIIVLRILKAVDHPALFVGTARGLMCGSLGRLESAMSGWGHAHHLASRDVPPSRDGGRSRFG